MALLTNAGYFHFHLYLYFEKGHVTCNVTHNVSFSKIKYYNYVFNYTHISYLK